MSGTKAVDVGVNFAGYTQHTTQGGFPVNVSATGSVLAVPGQLLGFYVNSTNAGTLVLYDALSATNPISGTITPALGWNQFPSIHLVGAWAVIGGTALNLTFMIVKDGLQT
jgi:hypothetical protein